MADNPLQTGRAIRFQHRVMGGSSSAKADTIGQDVEEETVQWTILLASISRWMAKRSTMRKARVAPARRLAIIMHAMLRDGTEFASA
jgi:hypothetical protein